MRCPKCDTRNGPNNERCWKCDSDLVPEAAPEWVGELEAALKIARKACERYNFRTDELMNLAAENAVVSLEELVEEERRRSPTDQTEAVGRGNQRNEKLSDCGGTERTQ